MTGDRLQITEADLISYVDGRLDDQGRETVEVYLASNPADARKVKVWQEQNDTLAALYRRLDEGDLPARFDITRIDRRIRAERTQWRNFAATSILVLVVGLTTGWFGRGLLLNSEAETRSILADAAQAHSLYSSDILHPVEVPADAEGSSNLQKWLSKRLDRKLTVPDLNRQGLRLVGGRILPRSTGPAAQLMYEDEAGQRVTLYVVPATDLEDSEMRRAAVGSYATISWDDEAIRCALVGKLSPERMDVIAKDVYQQLS
jgi:anti-sigma factor RsiW